MASGRQQGFDVGSLAVSTGMGALMGGVGAQVGGVINAGVGEPSGRTLVGHSPAPRL